MPGVGVLRERTRFDITEHYMAADTHFGVASDKYTFHCGKFGRRELPNHVTYFVPHSPEFLHMEQSVNTLIAHLQGSASSEWRAFLEHKCVMEIALVLDQTEGSDQGHLYSQQLHVRIAELDSEGERVTSYGFTPVGYPVSNIFDEHWLRLKRGKRLGSMFVTRYHTQMRLAIELGYNQAALEEVRKEPGIEEIVMSQRTQSALPTAIWAPIFDIKKWAKKILNDLHRADTTPNARPTTFGSTAFRSSTVPHGYELAECPVQVDASNCLYLVPSMEGGRGDDTTQHWQTVANFCLQSVQMLLKWQDNEKMRSGVELIIAERIVQVGTHNVCCCC